MNHLFKLARKFEVKQQSCIIDYKKLYKQAANFERKANCLEQCNDSLSDNDWVSLGENLDKSDNKTIKRSIKLRKAIIKHAKLLDSDLQDLGTKSIIDKDAFDVLRDYLIENNLIDVLSDDSDKKIVGKVQRWLIANNFYKFSPVPIQDVKPGDILIITEFDFNIPIKVVKSIQQPADIDDTNTFDEQFIDERFIITFTDGSAFGTLSDRQLMKIDLPTTNLNN